MWFDPLWKPQFMFLIILMSCLDLVSLKIYVLLIEISDHARNLGTKFMFHSCTLLQPLE